VTAHSTPGHPEALAAAKLGGIGLSSVAAAPSRGIAAVEWTIKEGDPIAGGTIYHLADRRMPAPSRPRMGFRQKARRPQLWSARWCRWAKRLLAEVIDHAKAHGSLPASRRTRSLRPVRRLSRVADSL